MQETPVQSSTVRSVAYSPETGSLHVNFLDGGTYEYSGVSTEEFSSVMRGPFSWSTLGGMLKAKGKPYTRVKQPQRGQL